MYILHLLAVFSIILSSNIQLVFADCTEWSISCGEGESKINPFYIGKSSTQYSTGQTLSSSEYNTVSSLGCIYCFSGDVSPNCPTVTDSITLVCTKTVASSSILSEVVANEKLFVEFLLAIWVVAFLVLAPPPLPKIVPLGVPQPVQLADSLSEPTGGGILPKDVLTVSIQICHSFTSFISIFLSNEDL